MKNFIGIVATGLRHVFENKIERVILVVFTGFVLVLSIEYLNFQKLNHLNNAIKKAEKKVDYRYFNLTRSIEDVHNVEIDTKQGRVIRHIQTAK